MEENTTARYKSKKFALRIIKLYKYLSEQKQEFILSKQLLRAGTSIGANLAESECASSKKDFINKVYIALKECMETIYWIDLLYEADYINESEYSSIMDDCEEIRRKLSATTKTLSKENII